MSTFFSVIIPLYNKEEDISNTLLSVINQRYRDFEIIVVNDGSTDGSVKVVESFSDIRLKIFHIENSGLSAARNYGAHQASAKFLIFLDADDTWDLNHLSVIRDLIHSYPGERWFGTSYAIKRSINNLIPATQYQNWNDGWVGLIENFFDLNKTQWLICIGSICVEKELFFAIGEFDSSLRCEEDIDFYVRIALTSPLVYCNVLTMEVNTLGTSRISDSNFDDASLNLFKYNELEKQNASLKQFLDFFRYTQYVKFMIVNNKAMAYRAKNNIDYSNLNFNQKFLLHMPGTILKAGLFMKALLLNIGISFNVSK